MRADVYSVLKQSFRRSVASVIKDGSSPSRPSPRGESFHGQHVLKTQIERPGSLLVEITHLADSSRALSSKVPVKGDAALILDRAMEFEWNNYVALVESGATK